MKSSVALIAFLALTSGAPSRGVRHKHHDHKRDNVVTVIEYVEKVTPHATEEAFPHPTENSSEPSEVPPSPTKDASRPSEAPPSTAELSVFGDLAAFSEPHSEFEDGIHDCGTLPLGQGVIAVDWISGLTGGYTTIMNLNGDTSNVCTDGFYCSYACRAGESKTQWPFPQPESGISVGGLLCKKGKLYRPNTSEKFLCAWGKNSASFVSHIDRHIAICRTDYPGSENMNIPTFLKAGSTAPVSVVDQATYYHTFENKRTSTQYYVNNAGVSLQKGCDWGDAESKVGNWAPLTLGASFFEGLTYLSLSPNPETDGIPNFNAKIEASPGAKIVGSCSIQNGVYYSDGNVMKNGCTVTVVSGSANFVFY
ncbi:SUN-domain-containing protein [Metschnikowia bicuspidata var. bicuspidata NRRL YB-4993]|uniref:SUN-domain-containing protein n=1 Tax=Metschnikowia bicuspidata var. bicuspidata NRRL YB-4993 TaxID=869754 RepID=A0A1A0HFC3_9ASCO|nr:SUN-domain-containing protein [Metschnikowia bicuspidata var. bicuspidata NRRL YB-4993]OBA22844.1 SUN-domain-containing protein [Metschnikowia bicuspidata var. bicuspidata NRRL YB-4993]